MTIEKNDYNILILEDEIPLQKIISRKLESQGFLFVTARTAKQALLLMDEIKFHAVWLDHYLLGEEDGLDFLVEIKRNPKWQNIPIFVVSNTASDDKIKSYITLGVEKYFVKSNHTLEEIVIEIKKVIKEIYN